MVEQNESGVDRTVRVLLGLLLLVAAVVGLTGVWQWIAGAVAGVLLLTGLGGVCLLYRLAGISTRHP